MGMNKEAWLIDQQIAADNGGEEAREWLDELGLWASPEELAEAEAEARYWEKVEGLDEDKVLEDFF